MTEVEEAALISVSVEVLSGLNTFMYRGYGLGMTSLTRQLPIGTPLHRRYSVPIEIWARRRGR